MRRAISPAMIPPPSGRPSAYPAKTRGCPGVARNPAPHRTEAEAAAPTSRLGIIPGSRASSAPAAPRTRNHPHVHWERSSRASMTRPFPGPSPRALGADGVEQLADAGRGTRTIPACVGGSSCTTRTSRSAQGHPRTRGEQFGLSGCWAPSMVLALACRLKPSSRRRPATVSAETRCPWRVSSAASFRVDFVVQRRGDIGSPRSSGSTSASSAGLSPESSSAAFFRPPSGWRTRPNGAWQEPSSAAPRETVASRTPRLQRRRS